MDEQSEHKYPIYRIHASWLRVDGRMDSTSFYAMLDQDAKHTDANQEAIDWWESMLEKKGDLQLLSIGAKYKGCDTWVLGWFSHYTRNVYLDDGALLASFSDFVDRKQRENVGNGHYPNDWCSDSKLPYYCLMGAEDRWRWKGPCRCDDCKKQGVVRIDH